MGLIQAAVGSVGGILADQWKEYFYCEALPADVLVQKGSKRVSNRSSNTKGNDNIITSGSVIAVADGQCMMIVEQGKIVEVSAQPGEFIFDASTEPTIFEGKLGDSIKELFKNVCKRFTFGGEPPKDQRVYYFNTKEIVGNKYGTPSPVPFRVVDERAAIDMDIRISCFGEYSYKIVDPLTFYINVCSNVTDRYTRDQIDSQLKSELLTELQPLFARVSEMGIRYSALPGHTTEMSDILKELLSKKWGVNRGIAIGTFGVSSVKAKEEDEAMILEMQRNAAFMDPARAAAHIAGSTGDAMKVAAGNQAGAAAAFMGVGMANNFGAAQMGNLYAMAGQNAQAAAAAAPAPAAPAADSWKCPACGAVVSGKFCPECGAKKPEANGWTCACGAVNQGKFCAECGAKKPAGVPQYKCDKCGWVPEDPAHPPKFCPECGDPFDDGDLN